jgi:hypothetical protein
MKKFIGALIILVVSLPFLVTHFLKTPEKEEVNSKTINKEGYSEKGYVKKRVDNSNNTNDELVSKRIEIFKKMKDKEYNFPEKSVTNKIANNLDKDININYFNPSEKSVLFNTYVEEYSVKFDIHESESPRRRLRSTGVERVNNLKASKINIEELFIGISQGKIKKIIVENAIGEKQEYYNLEFYNDNNSHFQILGDYGKRGTISLSIFNDRETIEGFFNSTNLKHKFNYMIFNKEGRGYVYDLYKKN